MRPGSGTLRNAVGRIAQIARDQSQKPPASPDLPVGLPHVRGVGSRVAALAGAPTMDSHARETTARGTADEQMLLQALARSAEAATLIGVRAVLVHAKDAEARGLYERYGFEPSPTHPLHLVLLMRDIRKSLGA